MILPTIIFKELRVKNPQILKTKQNKTKQKLCLLPREKRAMRLAPSFQRATPKQPVLFDLNEDLSNPNFKWQSEYQA